MVGFQGEELTLLEVFDLTAAVIFSLLNVVTGIWGWVRLCQIGPPEVSWVRWRRRMSMTISLSVLHFFLMVWWFWAAPLNLDPMIHALFTVFHCGVDVLIAVYHVDIVKRGEVDKHIAGLVGEEVWNQLHTRKLIE